MSESKVDRTVSGELWRDFCHTLEEIGETILRPETSPAPLDRAEGFRYLTRVLRMALEMQVEASEPLTPRFQLGCRPDIKLGCDNPDSYYLTSTLDSQHEYRVRGRLGTIPYFSIGAYFGGVGQPRSGCSGSIERDQLKLEADGSVDIVLSAREHPGNWVPLDAEAGQHMLIVRQTYLHKDRETVADLSIERLGEGAAPPLDAEAFHDRLLGAAHYVKNNVDLFADWARDFQRYPNEARELDVSGAQGDPNLLYLQGYWNLAPNEALVIDFPPPDCDYWNFQLNNYWLESLDYRDHRIELNNGSARLEADGKVRLVIAHRDPGHPNWIETAHHPHGTMGLRFVKAKDKKAAVQSVVQRVLDVDEVPAFSG